MNFEEKQLLAYNKRNAAVNASMDKLGAVLTDPHADHMNARKIQAREEIAAHLEFENDMMKLDRENSIN